MNRDNYDFNYRRKLFCYNAFLRHSRFYLPHGITTDKDNNYWITDVALHQVSCRCHNVTHSTSNYNSP